MERKCRFEMNKLVNLAPGYFHWPFKKGEPNIQTFSKGYLNSSYKVIFEINKSFFNVPQA